ncbi:DoxX family protein [Capnocytophaga sp. oral taxon 878]|mgnify:CR=1 FL=1|uniref:DoxX family protein n=1 Tax=Capnocytophaga sp. oral taxon 878 TaxID=1316596 RepID=UPI000D03546A|nr:DoxX family protein [Capnocytophaga sp. oral taxon 878]AVM50651.1 DoxX family protein [Capnocytophaga sp. oral taxon 878]
MKNRDLGLLVLRFTIGLLMIPHGINKVLHAEAFSYIESTLEAKGLPTFIAYGVFVGEIIAPLLIVLGFRTRLAALVMFFNGLSTLYLAYWGELTALTPHGGWTAELPALFFLGALALFFTGGGKYALSARNKWD